MQREPKSNPLREMVCAREGEFAVDALALGLERTIASSHSRRAVVADAEAELDGHLDATMRSFIAYCTSSALFLRWRISMTRYL
jgi:hypothetical protein